MAGRGIQSLDDASGFEKPRRFRMSNSHRFYTRLAGRSVEHSEAAGWGELANRIIAAAAVISNVRVLDLYPRFEERLPSLGGGS